MPDILLFAVKMPDLPGALETAAHWPAATVLAVENGVGADDLIVDERPAAWLIAGSLTASLETDRGTIRRLSRGGLGLARVRGEGDGLVRELVAAFRSGGLRAAALSDAQEMRWSKLLANLLGNATSALLDVDPEVAYRDPDVFAIERRALREALAVMRALELRPVALPGADVRLLTVASRLPAALVRPIMVRVVARGQRGPPARRYTAARMDTGALLIGAVSIVAAYLVGAIPWGVVIARVVGGPDPRTLGSGRTGGANVLRVLGPRVAAAAAVLDLLKGCVAVGIPIVLGAGTAVQGLAVLAAIIGHSRSVYIGFQGGRGVSPAFGALLVLWPLVALVIIPIFFGIIQLTRYSSLGSLISSAISGAILVAIIVIQGLSPAHLIYAVGGPVLIWLFHFDNIERLMAGRERTIDQKT